ncbi:serine/threonine-protein phosphatase (plasmid) [Deinococcus aquaticus]|uniref:Serine/threonine-protein phosphatase n=1 Tax=Deinococcus aquaticus TaxID=328692 RepID=A0ABY7V631_9DEIO|nr:ATP-binding SpoIIE family protein phosphatase [Deinococcus aquaticus]WDA60276.1 serine/threonine-protein phosphatase [Deinococcus aquaticus]
MSSPLSPGLQTGDSQDTLFAELLEQVADLSDQLVFLHRLIPQALALDSKERAAELVQEAATLINTPRAALHLDGHWVSDAPGWLRDRPAPRRPTVLPAGSMHTGAPYADAWRPTAVLLIPCQSGWLAMWGKRQFQAGERSLIEALAKLLDAALQAQQARVEAERYALQQRDRIQAHAVWRAVAPETLVTPAGYHLNLLSQPASDFGGDFQFQEGEWVVVGDVSGKGLPAAIITAMFATAFTVAARNATLSGGLTEALHDHLERSGAFCTLAAMQIRPDGALRVFNVGHPPVLLRRADGSLEEIRASAPPIGTFPLLHLELERLWLHPGDALILYSDGLFEAETPGAEPYGLDRVFDLASRVPPGAFNQAALQDLGAYEIGDDLTLLTLQRDWQARGAHRVLPGDLADLPLIGDALREALPATHPALMPAELAVTELVVNAIRHGGATRVDLRVHASGDDALLTLTDNGSPFDPTRQDERSAGELREHGYGLLIARRCSREWHYARKGALNRQTLRLRAPAPAAPGALSDLAAQLL